MISVAFYYQFLGLGGVETALLNRIKALNFAGVEAKFYFSQFYGDGAKYLSDRSDIERIDFESQTARRQMCSHDAIVVVDNPVAPEKFAKMELDLPIIYETHASLPSSLAGYYSVMNLEAIKALVVPSEFNRRLVLEHASPTLRPRVIRNCIDTDLFTNLNMEDHVQDRFSYDGPVVLWVGRLEEEKNPKELLKLASSIEKDRPDIKFLVVGDTTDYQDYLNRMIKMHENGLPANVSFVQKVSYEKMPSLYSLAANSGGLLLSTSHYESAPMTFLEAIACGCPVLSSDVGGASELLKAGQAGLLYSPGDTASAIDLICRMTSLSFKSERDRLTKSARSMVFRDHSLAAISEKYTSLIVELLANH